MLDAVRILKISFIAVSILGTNHILLTLLLVLLFGAFLSDLLEIVNKALHFVLSDLLVGLDIVDHQVDSLLGLFELVLLCLFHILLNGLSGLHTEVVLDHVDVLVDFRYFLVGVNEG